MTYAAIAVFALGRHRDDRRRRRRGASSTSSRSPARSCRRAKGSLLVFAANACFLIPLFAVVSIGVLLSTVTRNSAAAVVGTLGVTLILALVDDHPRPGGRQALPADDQYNAWQGLLRTPTDWAPDLALAVGLRALCRSVAARRLPGVPQARRRRRLSESLSRRSRPARPRRARRRPSAGAPAADRSARLRAGRSTRRRRRPRSRSDWSGARPS